MMTAMEFLEQLQADHKIFDSAKQELERWQSVKRIVQSKHVVDLVERLSDEVNAIAERQELAERLMAEIKCPTERACLKCRYVMGYTMGTIAKKMHYSERNIYNYLDRAEQHFEELYNATFLERR